MMVYLSPTISRTVVQAYLAKADLPPNPLTPRERQVLQLVAEGKTTKEIAVLLEISSCTRSEMPVSILIVDDDEGFRGFIKRFLEREPDVSVVGEARDGAEAVRLARKLRPDVVLMDIAMPRLNGLEATRRIKARRRKTKVIILTAAYDEETYRRAAAESGADTFLLKKTLGTDLLPTIRGIAP